MKSTIRWWLILTLLLATALLGILIPSGLGEQDYTNLEPGDTAWMLHVSNRGAIKPFVLQTRKAPTFVSQTSMENDDVFNRREYKFGAEARAAGAYGFWQLSVGSTGLN
ncbi:MAG: hypothetical protein EOM73_13930 [Bacteroidia bacterium]|nr:hypothetical protein [Bacteroidia bacterium]